MPDLELTIRQRIVLENIIRSEKSEDNDVLELLVDLRKKVGFIREEREKYIPIINGVPTPNEVALDATESGVINFEKAEIRKIEHLLKGRQWTTEDAETWLFDLKRKLTGIKTTSNL